MSIKNPYLLFLTIVFTTFMSCQKEENIIVEPPPEYTSTTADEMPKIHFEDTFTDLVPASILQKLQDGEPLTKAERIQVDEISYDFVFHKGERYSIPEVHEDEYILEACADAQATLVQDRTVYLFDSKEELEAFTNNQATGRGAIWGFKIRFWEHVNYGGPFLEYRYFMDSDNAISLGFVFPTWWQNRASSIVADELYIENAGPRDDIEINFFDNGGYSFSHTLDPGDVKAIHDLRYICPHLFQCGGNWNDKLIALGVLRVRESVMSINDVEALLIQETHTLISNIISNPEDDGQVVVANFSNAVKMLGVPEQWKSIFASSAAYSNIAFEEKDGIAEKWLAATVFKNGKAMPFYRFISVNNMETMDLHLVNGNVYTHPYHGGDNQHWLILKYYKWWWSAPEYKIINVQTGDVLTRKGEGGSQNVYARSSLGYRHETQRWRLPLQ